MARLGADGERVDVEDQRRRQSSTSSQQSQEEEDDSDLSPDSFVSQPESGSRRDQGRDAPASNQVENDAAKTSPDAQERQRIKDEGVQGDDAGIEATSSEPANEEPGDGGEDLDVERIETFESGSLSEEDKKQLAEDVPAGQEVYFAPTSSGQVVAYGGPEAKQAAQSSLESYKRKKRQQQAQEFEQDIILETPGIDSRDEVKIEFEDGELVAEFTDRGKSSVEGYQRVEASMGAEKELEQELGRDLVPGEDFKVNFEETKGRSPSAAERRQASRARRLGADEVADQSLQAEAGIRTKVDLADNTKREIYTSRLEQDLEQELGRDLEPGEDFTVEKTNGGYRAEPTKSLQREVLKERIESEEDVRDYEIEEVDGGFRAKVQKKTPEQSFISGALESVGIRDTPTQKDVGEGIQQRVGINNTATAGEVTDEKLGDTDDEIRQSRENVSQAATDPDSGYNIAENLKEFFDADREPLPWMEEELSEEELEEINSIQGGAPPGTGAVGPGKALQGAGKVAASADDLLKGAGVVGGAAAAAIGAEELELPDDEQRELESQNTVVERSELEPRSRQVEELTPSESVVQSEMGTPETGTRNNPTVTRTTGIVIGKGQGIEGGQENPEITEEDILPERGEPEQRGPSIREQQRREDLNPPKREFHTGENAVVGRESESQNRLEESQQRFDQFENAEDAGVGNVNQSSVGGQAGVGSGVSSEDQSRINSAVDAAQAADIEQVQGLEVIQQQNYQLGRVGQTSPFQKSVEMTGNNVDFQYEYNFTQQGANARKRRRYESPPFGGVDDGVGFKDGENYATKFENPVADPGELDDIAASVESDADLNDLGDL